MQSIREMRDKYSEIQNKYETLGHRVGVDTQKQIEAEKERDFVEQRLESVEQRLKKLEQERRGLELERSKLDTTISELEISIETNRTQIPVWERRCREQRARIESHPQYVPYVDRPRGSQRPARHSERGQHIDRR